MIKLDRTMWVHPPEKGSAMENLKIASDDTGHGEPPPKNPPPPTPLRAPADTEPKA